MRLSVLQILPLLLAAALVAVVPPAAAQTLAGPLASSSDDDAAAPPLSPATQALLAPARKAILQAKLKTASLPPAKDDREVLLRLGALDQAAWQALSKIDFAKIPLDEKAAAKAAIGDQIQPVDDADVAALLDIVPPEGWFAVSRYGQDGEDAAYRIVMHGDIDLWRRFAPVIGRFAAEREARGFHYALMSDRLAVHEGRPQSFGSQVACVDGVYKPYPIDDPEHVDERRLKLGLAPYAEYLKTFEGLKC